MGKLTHIPTGFMLSAMVMLCGCANDRMLPWAYMPTPPKECDQVLDFKVDPLPPGKSNAAKLSVDLAKEGAMRQQEHATSRVCAEYALRTAGVMKDKDRKPVAGEPVVAAATKVPPTDVSGGKRSRNSADGDPVAVNGSGS